MHVLPNEMVIRQKNLRSYHLAAVERHSTNPCKLEHKWGMNRRTSKGIPLRIGVEACRAHHPGFVPRHVTHSKVRMQLFRSLRTCIKECLVFLRRPSRWLVLYELVLSASYTSQEFEIILGMR